ncbi:alpha/beta fold hydrolase [Rhodococcus sp. NPDC058505]|uniref:alpha/beta fold hydrolase n=1 Tax=unclassified Rhodococcus (in: high G+C Gram-positive bacteria) TaxID=192944 RepID=UPI0036589CD5
MRTFADFTASVEGAAFRRAYDRVLGKWPVEVTSTDVESRFGTTRVHSCGRADAPPVVLLPGAGATSTVWFANVAALAENHRVHALDLLGDAGCSTAHGDPMRTADDLLSWLHAVTTGLGLDTFRLVGHSYGAMIALAFALHRPDRVSTLVLLDPTSCFAGFRFRYLARAAPILLRPTETRERAFIRWETDAAPIDDDWLTLLALGAEHFPTSRTIVPKRPRRAALAESPVDTTVILAADSKAHRSGRLATTISTTMPRAHVTVLDGATHHTLPMTPADTLNAALIRALGRTT